MDTFCEAESGPGRVMWQPRVWNGCGTRKRRIDPLVQDAYIRRVGFEQSRPLRRKKRKKGGRPAADFWSYLVTLMIGFFGFSCAEGGRRKQSGTESSGCSAKGGKATCGPRQGEQPAASIRNHPERFPGSSKAPPVALNTSGQVPECLQQALPPSSRRLPFRRRRRRRR